MIEKLKIMAGRDLKNIRVRIGTQQYCATLVNASAQQMHNWESGKVPAPLWIYILFDMLLTEIERADFDAIPADIVCGVIERMKRS